MAGPEGFSNPFENANTDRAFSAIGSGRAQLDGDKNGSSNTSRTEGHSPTSRSDLLQQSKKASGEMSAIVIRNLPSGMSAQTLRGMLLFSRDCESCEFIKSGANDDSATAMARFRSTDGALQAKELLNGRAIDGGSELRVEIINLTPGGSAAIGSNYWPGDVLQSSDGIGIRTSSRFGDTFREIDRASGRAVDGRIGPESITDGSSPNFGPVRFNDHSPIGHGQRVSGRSVIQDDSGDDDTTRLFGEPMNFLSPENQHLLLRRATAPTIPSGLPERFGGLSINSNVGNGGLVSPPSSSGVASPRGFGPAGGLYSFGGLNGLQPHQHRGSISNLGSPTSRFPPPGIQSPNGSSVTSGFPSSRHGQLYPPVNPADQNPPCNTLYVGNLPLDTSEDELKALFSKQRGYKRLCFRTKQNGPMCFVEFEEIHYAAGALKELYGTVLSNSVRGGIRLSFSKNPLGVRGPPQQTPISPNQSIHSPGSITYGSGSMNPIGLGSMAGQSFATASGPPPGLPAPMTYQNTRGAVSGHNGASASTGGNSTAFHNGRDLRNGSFSNYFAGR